MEQGLSSAQALVVVGLATWWGMWDLHRPGIEPVSPALAGGLLTTRLPGKSSKIIYIFGTRIVLTPFSML